METDFGLNEAKEIIDAFRKNPSSVSQETLFYAIGVLMGSIVRLEYKCKMLESFLDQFK